MSQPHDENTRILTCSTCHGRKTKKGCIDCKGVGYFIVPKLGIMKLSKVEAAVLLQRHKPLYYDSKKDDKKEREKLNAG